jgi:hypothetical protein
MQNFSSYRLETFVAGLHFKQESLVSWLNANKSDSSSERSIQRTQQHAVRLIEALRQRNAISDSGDKSDAAKRRGYLLHLEILKLIKPLRRTTWKLVPSPELSKGLENLKGWYLEQHGGEGDDLRYILGLVARLSEYGLLDSVRQCHCGNWFLAYNRRNKHHTPECKKESEKTQRKTPEGKEAWKLYMRKLRATKKKLNAKRKIKRSGGRRKDLPIR